MNNQRPSDDELTDEQWKRWIERNRLNGTRDFSLQAFFAGCVTSGIYYAYSLSKVGGMDYYWFVSSTSEWALLALFGYIVAVATMFIYEIVARNRVKGKIQSMGVVAGWSETEEYPTSLTNGQIGVMLSASIMAQFSAMIVHFAIEWLT